MHGLLDEVEGFLAVAGDGDIVNFLKLEHAQDDFLVGFVVFGDEDADAVGRLTSGLGGHLFHGCWLGARGFKGLGSGEERLRETDEAWLGIACRCCCAAGFWWVCFSICVVFFEVSTVAGRCAISTVVGCSGAASKLLELSLIHI